MTNPNHTYPSTSLQLASEVMHVCPDCGNPLHHEHYDRPNNKSYDTYTCQTIGCLLTYVTLRWSEWEAKQADGSLEAYRVMNRKAAQL